MITRALIFGGSGQVGRALQDTAPPSAIVIAHDVHETDIRDADAVRRAVHDARPDAIINCAAFTNVDGAESRGDDAFRVNAEAPGTIAEVAERASVRLVHISTDYVFDGAGHQPYSPDASAGPINVYGATKLDGERRVLARSSRSVVVRTAWVHSGAGSNFVRTAVRVLGSGQVMRVVDDQIGTPTRARHLAHALWRIVAQPEGERLLHFTDAGVASWFDVAVAVMDALGEAGRLPPGADVTPIASDEYPTPARRPQYTVLDAHACWRRISYTPPHWRHGVVASTHELLNA